MSGAMKRKSTVLLGDTDGFLVKILVDIGSTDSFIHYGLVKFLELRFQMVSLLSQVEQSIQEYLG